MERNYGIDFLKVMSMLMIVTLHVIGHGGILEAVKTDEPIKIAVVWALEIFAYCGVNIFALISGFVAWNNVEKPIKLSKLIYLWFSVVFYSMVITLIFEYFYPTNFEEVNWKECFLPITNSTYWYFTAYAYMFMLSPVLNKIAVTLEKDIFTNCMVFVLLFFSAYPTFFREQGRFFLLSDGYSFIWLVALYLVGLYINKYKVYENIKIRTNVIIIAVLYIITVTIKIIYFNDVKGRGDMLISYISPTIVFISICWLLICAKIKLPNVICLIFKFLAPTTFGVYLIHDNDLIRNYIIRNEFSYILELRAYQIVIYILISVFCIFVICSCIDKLRDLLFKVLCINKLSAKIEKIFDMLFCGISKKISSVSTKNSKM